MKKILLILFCIANIAFADSFESAIRAFAEGKFEDSIQNFQSVLKTEGVSPEILFNLANAQFRAGRIGYSILNYERALILNPRDPNVLANLTVARESAGLPIPQSPAWTRLAKIWSWNEWSWLAFAALLMLALSSILLFTNRLSAYRKWLKTIDTIAILLLLFAVYGLSAHWIERDRAIIIASDAVARVSPFENAEISFPLSEGEQVNASRNYENFILLRNRSGKIGWIDKNQIEKIIKI